MTWWEATLLGAVQGLTEFLPVSSSGHLVILQHLFGIEVDQGVILFDVTVHIASALAIILVLARDIIEMFTARRRLILMVVIGTLPLGAAAVIEGTVEKLFESVILVGGALIVTGLLLLIAEKLSSRDGTPAERAPLWWALIVGIGQFCGIVPGISRSGSTISAGLLCGLDKESAVKFSFLLAVPAILGVGVKKWLDWLDAAGDSTQALHALPFALGGVVSFAFSIFAIKAMLGIVRRKRLSYFSWYCIPVGIAVIAAGLLR